MTRLIDDLAAPNGVILSPDEKTLYVTARTSLYAVNIEATGYVFPAGKSRPNATVSAQNVAFGLPLSRLLSWG